MKEERRFISSCKRFAAFLQRSPDTATVEDVRRFQLHLAETGTSIPNRNRLMTGLRFLFRVTLRRLDLAAEIYHLREPQKIPQVISPDEARRLLAVANSLRTRLLLSLAYGCGLRASEVVRLKVKHIYSEWQTMTDKQRVQLMLETVIDLAMQGFPLKAVLTAFAQVREFRALGSQSYPMARALTSALLGKCLEPNTTSFEELLVRYGPMRSQAAEWGGEFGSTVRRQPTPPLQVPLRGLRQPPGSPASPHRS